MPGSARLYRGNRTLQASPCLGFLRLRPGRLPGLFSRHGCAVQLLLGVGQHRGVLGAAGLRRLRLRPLVRQGRLRALGDRLVILCIRLR